MSQDGSFLESAEAQNKDLFSFEPVSKIVHHLQRVLLHLGHIHCSALKFFVI